MVGVGDWSGGLGWGVCIWGSSGREGGLYIHVCVCVIRVNACNRTRKRTCGRMSPMMTIKIVEAKKPTRPLVRSDMRMEMSTFTATFPNSWRVGFWLSS